MGGFSPRLCLSLLLAVSLISYSYAEIAEKEKVLMREGNYGRVTGPDGGSGARGMKRRGLKDSDGGGESSVEVEDYPDPSANPKHNPPPPP